MKQGYSPVFEKADCVGDVEGFERVVDDVEDWRVEFLYGVVEGFLFSQSRWDVGSSIRKA